MAMMLGEEEDDPLANASYEQLLRQQLTAPPPAPQGMDIGQLGAALSQSANQLGTVGGRTADSSGLKNFADTLSNYKQKQQADVLAQNTKRQDILAKLAMMKDSQATKEGLIGQNIEDKKQARKDKIEEENLKFKHQQSLQDDRLAAKTDAKTDAEGNPIKGTVAQQAVDKSFAKDYNEYVTQGGFSESEKALSNARNVVSQLKNDDTLTGAGRGMLPDSIRAFTNPKAISVREDLEAVIQGSMRQIMGAQFTENEGKRLIARAFNPQLPTSVNAGRAQRLVDSLERAAKAKSQAAHYYEQNGTLTGFQGTLANSLDDMLVDTAAPQQPKRSSPGLFSDAIGAPAPANAKDIGAKPIDQMNDAEVQAELARLRGK